MNIRITHAFSLTALMCLALYFSSFAHASEAVVVENAGWQLHGDLEIPETSGKVPAVLMLNQAAGTRQPYAGLAAALAKKGIASLRLDLRGHGESTNLGEFRPAEATPEDLEIYIGSANADVVAAYQYLSTHAVIDSDRIGIVGASYSGEEMAEAGRDTEFAAAYVALSPGSFSDESIRSMDPSSVPWLFIVSRNEQFLSEIAAKVQATTHSVEIVYLPGNEHATDLLDSHPALAERIAAWLAESLRR